MNDKNKIIAGLVIFIVLCTFPIWYNLGKAAPQPKLKTPDEPGKTEACVESLEYMRGNHMQVLDIWRHSVVRNAERVYVNKAGKEFNMSLSNTCLDCHYDKANFCDRCHDYASVRPYCWDCHIDNPRGE